MATSGEKQSSQSSVRLLQIMECLASHHTPVKLQDLAREVGMTQPTVLRYLYALESTGYVYRDEEHARYGLTWRVCRFSQNLHSLPSLRTIASPFLNKLANDLSLGACLVTNRNDECLYLDCIDTHYATTLQRIGKQAPLHVTGSGKLLLSQYSEQQLEQYIRIRGLTRFTEYTITDPEVLRSVLEEIRGQDFAMDEEECELGLRCISCPIRDYSGQLIAAISVFGDLASMDRQRIQTEIYPALRRSANAISARLGFSEA